MTYTLWMGDCLEEMDRIESGSVDMICADLPYGTTACKWDVVIPFEPLWKQYKRVIKKNGAIVLFGSQPFTSMLVMSNLDWFRHEWIWIKNKAGNYLNAKREPMKEHEHILVFSLGNWVYNRQLQDRALSGQERIKYKIDCYGPAEHYGSTKKKTVQLPIKRVPSSWQKFSVESGLHPSQKPTKLLEYLIKTYTNEGDTILDNTCGSGSTLEAAMRNNRHSIGIEKDAGYYQIASDRLARVAAELRGELNHLPMFAAM